MKLPRKEDYIPLYGKSPEYLVPACFVPQISQRMSVLGSLVSCLLCFVDQPYFCLVSGSQVQLELCCCFSLALHSSFQVYWCAFSELIVFPIP